MGEARRRASAWISTSCFNDRDTEIEPLESASARSAALPASRLRRSAADRRTLHQGEDAFLRAAAPRCTAARCLSSRLGELAAVRQAAATRASRSGRCCARRCRASAIESAFAQQGIFALGTPAVARPPRRFAPPPAASAGRCPAPAAGSRRSIPRRRCGPRSWPSRHARSSPEPPSARAPTPPLRSSPSAAVAADLRPSAFRRRDERRATSTLGELYLAQGHLAEAEESFQSVLEARPGDTAALAGLVEVRVRMQRGDEAAAFADEMRGSAGVQSSSSAADGAQGRAAQDYPGAHPARSSAPCFLSI